MFPRLKPLLKPLVFHSLLCVNRPLFSNDFKKILLRFLKDSWSLLVLTCLRPVIFDDLSV